MSVPRVFGLEARRDEEHWITVSDLMAGLMVIFLFIAITYIRPIVEVQGKIREIVVAWNESEVDIHDALYAQFKDDLPRWNAELDRPTLSIRFKAPEVLFDQGRAELKLEFREILEDFFPRYLHTLNTFRSAISEVRIEGHTSSEWPGAATEHEAYFKNMALSQARTRSVLEYSLTLARVADLAGWAQGLITANGLSSSQLIVENGIENQDRSRRVEFRVRTNAKEQIVKILETIQ